MSGTASAFSTTPGVHKPRLRVSVGAGGVHDAGATPDQVVTTALTATCQKSNWYQADQHKVTFALFGDPMFDYHFWTKFTTMSIMVEIAFLDELDYTEVFRGFVDAITIDCMKGIVTCEGRNIIGLLTDSTLVNFSVNTTIGDILTAQWTSAGAPAPVFDDGFPADQIYGRYWPTDDSKTTSGLGHQSTLTPVDLAAQICMAVGANMYEIGGITHFAPNAANGQPAFTYVALVPQPEYQGQVAGAGIGGVTKLSPSNATSLVVKHNLTLSQWGYYSVGVNYDSSGKATGNTSYFPDKGTQPYPKPLIAHSVNKTDNDNAQYVKSIYSEFVMHEWNVTYKVGGPQIIGMKLTDYFGLEGMDPVVDGWFAIDTIENIRLASIRATSGLSRVDGRNLGVINPTGGAPT